jgi:hypothetical protein
VIVVDRDRGDRRRAANPPHALAGGPHVIFTSGSTGKAKAAAVPHRGWTNLMIWFDTEFDVTADDKVLVISSFSFDITQRSIMMPLIAGGQLHLLASRFYDPVLILAAIADEQILDELRAQQSSPADREDGPVLSTIKSMRIGSRRRGDLGVPPARVGRIGECKEAVKCRRCRVLGRVVVSSFEGLQAIRGASVPLGKPIFNSRSTSSTKPFGRSSRAPSGRSSSRVTASVAATSMTRS